MIRRQLNYNRQGKLVASKKTTSSRSRAYSKVKLKDRHLRRFLGLADAGFDYDPANTDPVPPKMTQIRIGHNQNGTPCMIQAVMLATTPLPWGPLFPTLAAAKRWVQFNRGRLKELRAGVRYRSIPVLLKYSSNT